MVSLEKKNYFHSKCLHQELTSTHIDDIISILCKLLLQDPEHGRHVRIYFSSLLLPVASKLLDDKEDDFKSFQRKCIALSILAETNQQVLR